MNNLTYTRLWLATIYVRTSQYDDNEGVRTQRLVVSELDNGAVAVRRKASQFATEWYGSRAKIEMLEPISSVGE